MLTALQLLKDQLKSARETFEGTAVDLKTEDLHKSSGPMAFPLGATYAHLIFSEDAIVQGMLQGKPALSQESWKDKTGANLAFPAMDENWEVNNRDWSNNVQIDLAQMREYAKAVYEATDTYINSLKDEDLDKEVDLGAWGKKTIAEMIYSFLIAHTNQLSGELSALKGVHGSKGYPF